MDIERWILCRRDYLRRDFEIEPFFRAFWSVRARHSQNEPRLEPDPSSKYIMPVPALVFTKRNNSGNTHATFLLHFRISNRPTSNVKSAQFLILLVMRVTMSQQVLKGKYKSFLNIHFHIKNIKKSW